MTALHSKNYTIFGELSSDLQKIIDKEGPGNIKFEKNRVVLEFSSGIYIAAEIENDKINKIRLGSYDFHETLEEFNKASGERNQSSLENILRSAKFLTKSAGKAEVLKYILENRLQLRIKKSKYQPESEISFDLSNEKFNLQLIFNFKEKRIVRGKLNFAKNSKSFAENAVNVLAGYLEGEKLKDDLSEVVGADFKMRNGNLTGGIDILINWLNSQNLETIATLQKNFTNEIHQVSLDNGAEKLILIIRNGKFTHAQIQQICLEENLQKFMRILKNGSSEELSSIFSTTFSLRSHQTKYPRFLSINIIDHLRKSQEIKIESRIYPGTAKIYMGKVKLYIYPKKLQIDSGFVPELRANEDVQDLRSYYDFFENILQTSKISKDFKMILDKEGTFINRARFLRGIQGPNRTLSMKNLGFSLYQVNDAIIYSDQLGASINFYFARKNEELVLERAEYDIDVFLGE
ncbi:unnamed protein product [Caenorhabditis angaria]|uniref:Uncharacterized protein n=1 Tax=Caenorhabditis angaria TaxID=860376 RepID=A0A9P1IKY1_9PELO|nr:unnamed protein product [Caenorhabditis angaria]